jgi:rhodanese-related sulfurtransferase
VRAILVSVLAVFLSFPAFAVEELSPKVVHAMVQNGEMILVDIRRPDEWATTGIAKGALRINMLDGDFKSRIEALRSSYPGKKIGLICQAGIRSARMSQRLEDAGMTNLVDVKGGTQEWIDQDLPVKR